MCLAIYKPEGKTIPEKYLRDGMEDNSDGAGVAYTEDGKVSIHKGWFRFDTFHETFKKLEEFAMLIHFRKKTHGEANAENCHPFRIDDHHALIHNGILPIQTDKGESDTAKFTELVMKPMFAGDPEMWKSGHGKYLIAQAIGSWNKIVIMNSSGVAVIYNEDKGHWREGVWYSNGGYLGKQFKSCRIVRGYSHGDWDGGEFVSHSGYDYHSRASATNAQKQITGEVWSPGIGGGAVIDVQKTADGEGWEPTGPKLDKIQDWLDDIRPTLHAMFGFTIKDYTQLALDYNKG